MSNTASKTTSAPVVDPVAIQATGSASKDPVSAFVEISPAQAAAWLKDHNPKTNRPVSLSHAKKLAQIMVEGRWQRTHQGVAFDEIGTLVDGQHRLKAIVLANKTVTMMVTTGVDRNTFRVVDTGRNRTTSQIFGIDQVPNWSAASTLSRSLYFLHHNGLMLDKKQIDSDLLRSFYEDHKDAIRFALKYSKGADPGSLLAVIAYAYEIASEKKKALVADFADKFTTGANLAPRTGPLLLRNWLAQNRGKGKSVTFRNEIVTKTTKALVLFANKETAQRLFPPQSPLDELRSALK